MWHLVGKGKTTGVTERVCGVEDGRREVRFDALRRKSNSLRRTDHLPNLKHV